MHDRPADLKSYQYRTKMRAARESGDIQFLIDSLNHHDASIQRTAARFLGMTRNSRGVKPLIRRLDQPHLRMIALKALGRIGDASAAPALHRVAVEEGPTDTGRVALSSLGAVGDRRAIGLIAMLLTDPTPQSHRIRKWAAAKLIELHGTEADAELRAARGHVSLLHRLQIRRVLKALAE
jgi:HEAT repeat protein